MKHHGLQCKLCKSKIFSFTIHHYVECLCGNCFVDGGLDYFRVGITVPDSIEVLEIDFPNKWSLYLVKPINELILVYKEKKLMLCSDGLLNYKKLDLKLLFLIDKNVEV